MTTAEVFENGRSQMVKLPKEYWFSSYEVMINKIGDVVLLMLQISAIRGIRALYVSAK